MPEAAQNLPEQDWEWRNEQIHLNRAKGCKSQTLPLITVAGNAIISYQNNGYTDQQSRGSLKKFLYNKHHKHDSYHYTE